MLRSFWVLHVCIDGVTVLLLLGDALPLCCIFRVTHCCRHTGMHTNIHTHTYTDTGTGAVGQTDRGTHTRTQTHRLTCGRPLTPFFDGLVPPWLQICLSHLCGEGADFLWAQGVAMLSMPDMLSLLLLVHLQSVSLSVRALCVLGTCCVPNKNI